MVRPPYRFRAAAVLIIAAGLLGVAACSSGDDTADGSTTTDAPDESGSAGDCAGTTESPDTRFIVDECGRVVMLRGVNVEASSKGDTQEGDHLPASGLAGQSALSTWGWNSVRFLVFWGAIEPEKGKFSDQYLDGVEKWLDWYAEHDIHVVLDMHQDLYAWKLGYDGAPDWAVDTRGAPISEPREDQPWFVGGADPAVQNAFQSFWNPLPGQPDLQAEWLASLAFLADRFKDHPAVIGYDVMNEPGFANGDLAATLAIQAQAAEGKFQNPNLTQFMQRGIDAVRQSDQNAWVMVELTSLLNAFPYPGDLEFEKLTDPRNGPPRLTYAGHLYEQNVHDGGGYAVDSPYLSQWEQYRVAEARRMNGSLWIGEWGGTPDQERMTEYINEVTAMADRQMIGWSWYSWDPGGWSPVESDGTTPSPNGTALLRIQPRAIAGTPSEFSWDPAARQFRMAWTARDDAAGPTELAVPSKLFDDGIKVVLDGKAVTDPSWDRKTSVLRVEPKGTAGHTVCIEPADGTTCTPS